MTKVCLMPRVGNWINTHLPSERARALANFNRNTIYHLQIASDSCDRCITADPNKDEESGIALLMNGDTAIRQASSALDVCLQFVNVVLEFRIAPKHVNWRSHRDGGKLRRKLIDLPGGIGQELEDAMARISESIGYKLLNDYRNWVTHRGSPGFIRDEESGTLQVMCYPFAQPDYFIPDIHIDRANEVEIPGFIRLSGNVRNVICRNTMIEASPTERASNFNSQYAVRYESQLLTRQGTPLEPYDDGDIALYTIDNYKRAVNKIVDFTLLTLTMGDWDVALTNLCDKLHTNNELGNCLNQ